MVLEDFFTLKEMKDGLVAIDRVEELVAAMQKEKDSAVKNTGATASQWSTVASVLAATAEMAVLNQFIQLGGLNFFDEWLQEAQRYSDSTGESSLEESICDLLRVLEKLPIDKGTPAFSGIMCCVKNFVGHRSSSVQESAKALFNQVNQDRGRCDHPSVNENLGHQDEVKSVCEMETLVSSTLEQTDCKLASEAGADEDSCVNVVPEGKLQHRSSDCSQLESVTAVDRSVLKKNSSLTSVSQVKESGGSRTDDQSSSIVFPSSQASQTIEESSSHPAGGTDSFAVCSSPGTANNGKTIIEDGLTSFPNEELGTESNENNLEKFAGKEDDHASFSSGGDHVSSADTHAQESVMEPVVTNDVADKMLPTNAGSNSITDVCTPNDLGVGSGLPKFSGSKVNLMTADQNDGTSNVSLDLSVTGCISPKTDSVKTRFTEEAEEVKEADSIVRVGGSDDSVTTAAILNSTTDAEASDVIVKSRVDADTDFVLDDALEVARQVAKEVEREVVDYREQLCSSSSKQNSDGRGMQPGSPDSVNGEQDQPMAEPPNEIFVKRSFDGGVLSTNEDERIVNAKNKGKLEDYVGNHDLSQVTEATQRPAHEKKAPSFDLNEESCSQEMEHPRVVVSSSITAVSVPKEVEHELLGGSARDIKGKSRCSESAATSAFCPASVFRIPDADKAFSVEGSSSSKQRLDFLDIDLNIADGNTNGASDPVLAKMPVSSGLPSGESSVEVSSKRPMWLMWDLNSAVGNEERSPSPASSSSLKQPVMIDLNLTDHPSLPESHAHPSACGASSSQVRDDSEGLNGDGPYVNIFGRKVAISRENVTPQTRSLLPSGPFPVSQLSAYAQSGGGSGVQYPTGQYAIAHAPPPSQGFLYNGLRMMEPSMSLSPAIYGSVAAPYQFDPRENPMGQHMMSSPMVAPPSYSRSPFPMSSTSAPVGFNWMGPSQPNLDLGSGLYMGDNGNREGTSRQVFMPGNINMNMMEDQTASTSRPMSPDMRKRKEPDNGFELGFFPRHQQPPWH